MRMSIFTGIVIYKYFIKKIISLRIYISETCFFLLNSFIYSIWWNEDVMMLGGPFLHLVNYMMQYCDCSLFLQLPGNFLVWLNMHYSYRKVSCKLKGLTRLAFYLTKPLITMNTHRQHGPPVLNDKSTQYEQSDTLNFFKLFVLQFVHGSAWLLRRANACF